jgi:hypothetical protein
MPVSFLTPEQRENYGGDAAPPTADELTRYYHLNDDDLVQITSCRSEPTAWVSLCSSLPSAISVPSSMIP